MIACPTCEAPSRESGLSVHTTQRYVVCKCPKCGLAFTSPRPTEEELREFYTSGYFAKPESRVLGYANYRGMGELNSRAMWRTFRDEIIAHDLPRSLLDVGAATGGFIDEARKDGWAAEGVELSEEATRIAREEFGAVVHHGDIFSPALAGGSSGR